MKLSIYTEDNLQICDMYIEYHFEDYDHCEARIRTAVLVGPDKEL